MISGTVSISIKKILTLETALFSLAFCIPLLFNGSQIVTGILINTILFVAATRVSKRIVPYLAVIPSIGAISHGMLFGSLTIYLLYFLPLIWIGNMLLMYISRVHQQKTFSFIYAAIAKSTFLYIGAFLLVSFDVVPTVFLVAMGVMQFVTAIVGGVLARILSTHVLTSTHE